MLDLLIMAPSPLRRDWLSKCVDSEPAIRVAGTAATLPMLRSLMSENSADILLIELRPEPQLIDVRDWLLDLLDVASILLLISEPDPAIFNLIRSRGPCGLLQSTASAEQIVQAIKSIASGLSIFDSVLAPKPSEDESPAEQLTVREGEVLRLLADGLGNKDIAAKLGISEHTIKFHIRSILGKLGATSRTEAVTRGLRTGLIEL
jgi:DNA-binding NarL/FixJ family response regulator